MTTPLGVAWHVPWVLGILFWSTSLALVLYVCVGEPIVNGIPSRYSKLPVSSTNYRAFIGYGGETGQRIAEDLCGCLPRYGVYALAITPNITDARPYLESEEYILRLMAYGNFDAAIMVCTRGAFRSTRFRDEAEKD